MLKKLTLIAAALVLSLPLAATSQSEAVRLVRVTEVVSVKIEKVTSGDNTHRIVAVGKVPTEGWTNARLRVIKERHPNNAVAGFELVASPPGKGVKAAKTVSEVTATLDTVIGAVQHTVIVRGQKKSVECTMTDQISCE